MRKIIKLSIIFYLFMNVLNFSKSNESFFEEGLKLYNAKKYDDAQFMFERSIVFNPKNSNSYLYLAKIFNIKEDQKKEEKKS